MVVSIGSQFRIFRLKKDNCTLLDITLNFTDIKISLHEQLVTVQFSHQVSFIQFYYHDLHVTNCSAQQTAK